MKIAESWLREWVNPDLDVEALAHRLTMAGHEVDSIETEGEGLEGVVIAEVFDVAKHPNADRLSVCQVSTGGEPVDVVCGAPNVVKGMKSPFATPGVKLPNGIKLKKSKIRGVVSNGMLCAADELGLGDDHEGIIALPDDAPVGTSLSEYLALPDTAIDFDLTPNRGDCFSVLGIAREVAALTGEELKSPAFPSVAATIEDVHPVDVEFPAGCPVFAGRVVRNIDPKARSPIWMAEKLRRSGLRPIHPVVDVTNYVMLELGQPLHAFDFGKLAGGKIVVRRARPDERLRTLDGVDRPLTSDMLVIADANKPVAVGGVMGGAEAEVTAGTTMILLEAANFDPVNIRGTSGALGLRTEASIRF